MPLKPCLDCGMPSALSRCRKCIYEQEQKNAYKRFRQTSHNRGYDKDWRVLRIQVLERDRWICYLCGKKLVEADATVDHIVPITKDESKRLDMTNLAACCRSCNSRKRDK